MCHLTIFSCHLSGMLLLKLAFLGHQVKHYYPKSKIIEPQRNSKINSCTLSVGVMANHIDMSCL